VLSSHNGLLSLHCNHLQAPRDSLSSAPSPHSASQGLQSTNATLDAAHHREQVLLSGYTKDCAQPSGTRAVPQHARVASVPFPKCTTAHRSLCRLDARQVRGSLDPDSGSGRRCRHPHSIPHRIADGVGPCSSKWEQAQPHLQSQKCMHGTLLGAAHEQLSKHSIGSTPGAGSRVSDRPAKSSAASQLQHSTPASQLHRSTLLNVTRSSDGVASGQVMQASARRHGSVLLHPRLTTEQPLPPQGRPRSGPQAAAATILGQAETQQCPWPHMHTGMRPGTARTEASCVNGIIRATSRSPVTKCTPGSREARGMTSAEQPNMHVPTKLQAPSILKLMPAPSRPATATNHGKAKASVAESQHGLPVNNAMHTRTCPFGSVQPPPRPCAAPSTAHSAAQAMRLVPSPAEHLNQYAPCESIWNPECICAADKAFGTLSGSLHVQNSGM
jgi:hypothetical protein